MKHPKSYDTTPDVSRRMAKVKLKKGNAEVLLAKALWHKGFRYRYNYKKLPGSPDIAVLKYHIAIFIDGEFWHGYDWHTKKDRIRSNKEYWTEKIQENMARDTRNNQELKFMNWDVVRFWSKEVEKHPEDCVRAIEELVLQKKVAQCEDK